MGTDTVPTVVVSDHVHGGGDFTSSIISNGNWMHTNKAWYNMDCSFHQPEPIPSRSEESEATSTPWGPPEEIKLRCRPPSQLWLSSYLLTLFPSPSIYNFHYLASTAESSTQLSLCNFHYGSQISYNTHQGCSNQISCDTHQCCFYIRRQHSN